MENIVTTPYLTAVATVGLRAVIAKLFPSREEEILNIFTKGEYDDELIDDDLAEALRDIETQCYEQALSKADKTTQRGVSADLNRCAYTQHPILSYRGDRQGQGNPWRFDKRVMAKSLMGLAMSPAPEDVIQVQFWTETVMYPEDVGYVQWLASLSESKAKMNQALWREGYAVVAENVAVRMASEVGQAMLRLFPDKIDFGAYCASILNAPVIPHAGVAGRRMKVIFMRLESESGSDLGTDGSGWCHPKTTGGFAHQIRAVDVATGLFAKGMIYPNDAHEQAVAAYNEQHGTELIPEETLILDWNQIKGSKKSEAEPNRVADTMEIHELFVGFINRWYKPQTISGGFELLQQLKDNQENYQIIDTMIEKRLKALRVRGTESLLKKAGRDDKSMAEMITTAQALGLNPMSFPVISAKVNDLLAKELYTLSQGAGISGKQHVLRLDSTVPQGCAVIPGYRLGSKIAVYRFPILLAQGLQTHTVVAPTESHLLCNGDLVPFTITLNPIDALAMQGDDDGDICGVLSDKLSLRLFANRLHNQKLSIEVPGKAKKYRGGAYTQDGLEYLSVDHTGPVGLYTILQAHLLAMGKTFEAMLMCFAIQAAVDAAKKQSQLVRLAEALVTDQRALAPEDRVIIRGEDGIGRLNEKWMQRDDNGEIVVGFYDMKEIINAVNEIKEACGCTWVNSDQQMFFINPIRPWRRKDGRQHPTQWQDCRADGRFENLLHRSYQLTRDGWESLDFNTGNVDTNWFAIRDLVPGLLGCEPIQTGNAYKFGLATTKGIRAFGQQMTSAMKRGMERKAEQVRKITEVIRALDTAMAGVTNEELATIWWNEISIGISRMMDEDGGGASNFNNALRALCAHGHRGLQTLGISRENPVCPALNVPAYTKVAETAYNGDSATSVTNLWQMMVNSSRHEKLVPGQHVIQCPECSQALRDALVKVSRANGQDDMTNRLRRLLTRLQLAAQPVEEAPVF